MKNHIVKHWPEYCGFSLILLIGFYFIFFNNSIFIYDYDMIEQYVHFYIRGYDSVYSSGFGLWDYSNLFGASIFSYVYYFLFSPFWLLYLLLPNRDLIPYAVLYLYLIKFSLLFFFTSLYLRKLNRSQLAVFVGSTLLTFSGFSIAYLQYSNFLDFFVFVPLALYSIERFLKDQKWISFTLIIALMAIMNGYFLYLFSIYFFIYFLMRLIILNDFSITILLKQFSHFFLIYLLGLGIGAIGFLPGLSSMIGSSRLQLNTDFFQTINLKDLFRYITALIQPIVDRNNFNPLVNSRLVPSYGWSGGAAIYSFILTPLLFLQFFFIKIARKEKIIVAIVFLLFTFIACFPNLYFFLQGNKDTRWMVIFILLFIYVIPQVIHEYQTINKKVLILSFLTVSLLLVFSYYGARWWGLQNVETYFDVAKRNVIFLGLILFVYTFIFLTQSQKYFTKIVVLIMILESMFILYNIFLNPFDSVIMESDKFVKYELTDTQIIDSIQELDDSIYRIDAQVEGGFNDPVSKDYLGFTFYASTYNYNSDPFIQNNIAAAGGWVVGGNSGKSLLKNLLGSKYWFDDSEFYLNPSFGYIPFNTVNMSNRKVIVYQNQYPLPLIRLMDESLSLGTWNQLNALNKARAMMNYVVLEDSSNTLPVYIDQSIDLGAFSTQKTITFDYPQIMATLYISSPRSEEVKMTIYLDDKLIDKHYSYESQYTSIYIDKPFNRIEIEVTNLYGVPEAEFMNTASIDYPDIYYEDWYKDIEKDFVSDFVLDKDYFSGSFMSETNQIAVSSIAYDKDWVIQVNGEQVETMIVNGGFIGFKVPSGYSTFEAHYFPRIILPSIIITLLSLIVLLFFSIVYKLKQSKLK